MNVDVRIALKRFVRRAQDALRRCADGLDTDSETTDQWPYVVDQIDRALGQLERASSLIFEEDGFRRQIAANESPTPTGLYTQAEQSEGL